MPTKKRRPVPPVNKQQTVSLMMRSSPDFVATVDEAIRQFPHGENSRASILRQAWREWLKGQPWFKPTSRKMAAELGINAK